MKAVLYQGPRQFEVTQVPTPEPGPGQVLVKMAMAGICATDVHIHEGDYAVNFPLVPGHEMTGTVEALGPGVSGLAVGEQVAVNPNSPCGRCDYCLSGRLTLCQNPGGLGTKTFGFFAEYVAAPREQVFSVSGLGVETAVFSEPAACAMHGVERLAIQPGSSALVIGAGPTGLLLAQFIASGGASSVTVAAPLDYQLRTAAALGASATVLVRRGDVEGSLAAMRAASPNGEGYDVVVEATGSPQVGEICVPLTRTGGTVLIYGVTKPEDRFSVPPFDIFRREITIKGSYAEMTTFTAAIAALRAGRARTDGIITHRFALDDFAGAIEAVAHDDSAHKVVMVP